MTKRDFIKEFPDVKIQLFETIVVESRSSIQKIVEEAIKSLNMGLVYYESSGKKIKVFTSNIMKKKLDSMTIGSKVKDPNSGLTGKIVSEKIIVCGCYCVRVEFPNHSDVYDCNYLIFE